ncbi:MAG: DUF5668 domain-containing protein [Thermoanaerobaculia bacterium]|nr:DUF5668 domain-containing protein [Thermoanaerobaculia bacterium]
MSRADHPVISPVRLIIGLAVIAVGLILTLDQTDLVDADELLIFWPVVLIAIGLTKIGSRRTPDLAFALIFVGVGLWFLAANLEWVDIYPYDYLWPAVLILAGAYLLAGGLRRRVRVEGGDADSFVSSFALWSGIERTSSSDDFRGADLTAIMGGVELDLRQASIRESPAVINAFTMWGGIDLRVPQDWNIEYGLLPILGGYSDNTDQSPGPDSPTLVIKGAAIMAGLDIKN